MSHRSLQQHRNHQFISHILLFILQEFLFLLLSILTIKATPIFINMQADSWLVILILLHACIGKYSCRQFTLWKKLKFSSFLSCLLKLLMLTPVCTFFKQQWLLAEGYFIFFTPGYLTPGLRYITLPLMSCRDSVEAYSCFFAS